MLKCQHMKHTPNSLVFKYVVADLIREILFLPIWWYSIGLVQVIKSTIDSITGAARFTGLDIWAKNILVPMYGETGFAGRFVSFLVRLFMVIVRGAATLVWVVFAVALFVVYLFIFPLSVFGIFYYSVGSILK